jgi:hypothetical protein
MLFLFIFCIITYVHLTTHVTCVASAGDENIIFDEDEEVDEGFLFAGQGVPSCSYSHIKILF